MEEVVVNVWRPSGLRPMTEISEVELELERGRACRREMGSSMPVVFIGTFASFTMVVFVVVEAIVSSISVNGVDVL